MSQVGTRSNQDRDTLLCVLLQAGLHLLGDGLFVAFHGSWNRAPLPQAGYRVVFAPFADGKATGKYITIATGRNARGLRANGLAVAEDGSLFVSGDRNEKIWRISRKS